MDNYKKNYLIFGYSAYSREMFKDIIGLNNIFYYDFSSINFIQKLIRKILFLFFEKTNLYLLFPNAFSKYLYMFLYNFCVDRHNCTIDTYCIFLEGSHISYDSVFFYFIKKKFCKIKFIFYFLNAISDPSNCFSFNYVLKNRNRYNLIITFNKKDSEQYNFKYYEPIYSKSSENISEKVDYDVYYIGAVKSRKKIIEDSFEFLCSQGLKCNFNVLVAPGDTLKSSGINIIQKPLSYREVINGVLNSRCILEILDTTIQDGSSLRTYEAISYKKKLLSNNIHLKNKWFYNKSQMFIFKELSDIDINFIKTDLQNDFLLNPDDISPKFFLKFLEKEFGD